VLRTRGWVRIGGLRRSLAAVGRWKAVDGRDGLEGVGRREWTTAYVSGHAGIVIWKVTSSTQPVDSHGRADLDI
jgi:hypothetical protein